MSTTFAKFAGKVAGNYCSMPRVDVEVLEGPRYCGKAECGKEVVYEKKDPKGYMGKWVHTDGSTEHWVSPAVRCTYCGTQDPAEVTFVQASWSDETRCTRCGGVDGRAIGD